MPLTLKDFRASFPQYDDVPDEDLVQSLHQKFYSDIPLADFAKSIEAPVPTASAGDYGRALMSGFAGLAEAGGKGMTYVPGLEEVGQGIQETGKEAADYWRESMTPAGKAAMSNEIITDDFSLGETPLQSIGLQAMASAPSMLGAAIPGAGAVGVLGKIGGKTLQELAKHPGAIGFLAKYGPSATAFGASEGAIAALQNASQTEFEIRQTPIDKLRAESPSFQRFYAETDPNLPPEQRDAMALDATAKAAADDVALKTFFSTGGIGIATGGGAMGWLQRMFGKEAAKEAAKKGFIRMVGAGAGTEFIQETPQSGAEQYIQQKAMQEHVDPTIDPEKGVTSAALSGGVVGAVLGGAGGAGGYVVRPRDDERDIALKVASAQTVDEAIAAATAAAEGAPATGIINQVLGGHASGVSIPQVIEGGAMGVSGAETLEPTYGQTLAQVGERQYETPPQELNRPAPQIPTDSQIFPNLPVAPQAESAPTSEKPPATTIPPAAEEKPPAPISTQDIHALAEKKHIAWDNDPDFMDFTESVTGKRHLDALTELELQALAAKLAARPDQEHKYSSSQVAVKGDISVKLRQAAKKLIAAEDVDPTEGLEKRPHITLKYGLRTGDAVQLEQVLAGEGPVTATVGNIEIFEPENEAYDVVVARVESPELTRLNQKVSAAIPNVDTHPDYKPHVTLGYVKKGTGKKYAKAKTGLEGKTLTFNAVEFSSRDGKITPIELKGTAAPETTDNLTPLLDQIYDHDKSSQDINKRATDIKDSVPSKLTEEEARAKLTEILDGLNAAPEAETTPQALVGRPTTEIVTKEELLQQAINAFRTLVDREYNVYDDNGWVIEPQPKTADDERLTDTGPVLNKEKIRENMPKHRQEYDKALEDLRAEVPEMLQLIRNESMAKRLAEEAEADAMFRAEQEKARREAEAAPPPPVGELNDDEIAAAFDQAAAELQESTQEKPNAPNPGDDAVGNVIIDKPPPGGWTEADKVPPSVNRTAAKLASDAAKLGVKGIDEALKGLVELFGGGKIKSFPAGFDEESYQKAKPHFEAALKAFQDAGKTLVDLFKFLIEKFGLGIRPYAERFAKDQKLSMGLANAPSASRQVANWVRDQLKAGNDIRWQDLFAQSDKAYGGTQADGKYTSKDAYDAMEAGVNLYILDSGIRPNYNSDNARRDIGNLTRLLDSIPTQTKRTAEMDEYQQFSTPPPLAYAAAWAANIRSGESMLEPSAGIGGIAIFADMAGAKITLNELSSRRAAVLKEVLPNARLFQENAEQLHNLLPDEIKPTVIVMNPPFSSTAGRMEGARKTEVGAQHIEQALKRLAPKGRLVAIVGEGMGADKPGFREWWNKIKAEYNVRANVGMSGKNYAKYGTTFDNQLLVIDKTGQTKGDIVTGKVDTIEEVIKLVEGVRNDRPATDQAGEPVTAQPGGGAVSDAGVEGQEGGAARPDADALGTGKRPGDQTATPGTPDAGEGGSAAQPARADETQPGAQVPDRGGRRSRAGRGGTAKAGEPSVGGDVAAPDAIQQYDSAVKLGQAEKQKVEGELTEAIFEDYQPQRLKVAGAKPHPGKLVQSSAMAAVDPPAPTYTPNLPREVITQGKLSLAQIEAVVYAGQAHEQSLPDGSRRGFFIGDGTGVGKGREIAGIILDNLRQGRKKAMWISEKRGLFKDAGRDFAGVGGDKTIMFQQHKFPAVGKISPKGGIMFSTYSMLRGGEKKQATDKDKTPGKTRVAQIVEWLGPDFDGVIVFDEAHNMANAVQKKGERGKSDPSKQAMAGLELQKLLPKARVVYVSATGATEVSNLVYAQRLGLWGEGTAFSGSTDFVTKVDAGGVAAMELVARDLKALGSYIARSLSFEGVTYERLEHELTPLQTDVYNKLAEAWQIVLANVNQALEATLQGKNGRAKSAAMSRFWSTEQRFFNQVITSMQMPTIIDDARKHLDAGEAVVLQLVNTNEAEQERQVARAEQENIEIEELDFTPRQSLMDYVRNGFPVQQYEEFLDDEGNKQTRPVVDSQGNPVINKEMVEKRDALLKELESIQVPDNPIDIILETFGPKMVGEVTGRSRRFIRQRGKDGEFKMIEEKRSASSAQDDAQAFMDDKRRVLIFSDAGGTGYSFHADNTQPNKRRRYHYLVQPGWRADKAVQGFGRTHRTDEASQPHYVLPTTSLKAQKRFISSIARRLDQLGALTKGQRQTGSQGLFNAADNLESKYATEAMQTFFEDLYANRTPLNTDETIGMMGLENLIDPKTGALNETKIPTVPKFLNRLLALDTEMQNKVFDEFFSRMEELVHNAIQKGTYDQGVETLKALNVHKLRDEVAYTDKRTGAETHYVELELTLPTEFHEWDEVQNRADLAKKDFAGYFLNNKTGKVFAMIHRGTRTGANGQLLKRAVQIHVAGLPRYIDNAGDIEAERQSLVFPHLDQKTKVSDIKDEDMGKGKPHYQKLDAAQAQEMWEKEHQAAPKTHTKTVHLISGAILPIWDRVTGQPKVIRTQTDEGERLLGRVVSDDDLKATLRNLGIGSGASKLTAGQILTRLERGASALLANGWQIKQVRVADDNRLEITAASFTAADQRLLKEQGAFIERINWRERVFIPTGDEAENILDRIIKNKPVVEIIEKGGAAEFSLSEGEFSAAKLAPKPETIAYAEEETEATKDLRKGVEVALGRPLHKGAFTQVDTPASMEGIVKVIKTMFKKEVVFFKNNVPHIIAFNGMAPRHNKTTMYLNVDSTNPLVRVAGHELTHLLRREHKDIYNRLYRMALDEFNPEAVTTFTNLLDKARQKNKQVGATSEDLVHEEMLANFIGDNFARPEFWNALYKQSPSLMQKLAMLVRNFVTSVLKAANLRGYGSEYYFKDLERMREAAVNALSEYSEKKGAGTGEETEAEFSLADILPRRPEGPVSDYHEANERLRERDQTIWHRAKKFMRRQFSPGGLLPSSIFDEKITRDSNFNAVEFDIRHHVGKLENSVRADYGKKFIDLPDETKQELSDALAGEVSMEIPERTREAIYVMRQYIDTLSTQYAQMLDDEVYQSLSDLGLPDDRIDGLLDAYLNKLTTASMEEAEETALAYLEFVSQEGARGMWRRAINTGAFVKAARSRIIRNNIGEYVHRSYQAFDDAKWFQKLDDATIDAARKYLIGRYLETSEGMTEDEAARKAEIAIHEIVKNGTAYDSFAAFIREGKLGAKDLTIMMRRKEIAPEIRALLGEYQDARLKYAKSATKMGRLIWNQKFLDAVRSRGMGVFLFEGDDRPPQATKQIAAESSEVYAPLNGLWTFPELDQALRDALGKEHMDKWYETIVQLNGMVKFGKTVLSPTTAARNWQSAMFFAIANGHFDFTQIAKSVAGLREYFTHQGEGARLAYLRKLVELGVVYDNPYAGEMMRLLSDSKLEDTLLRGKDPLKFGQGIAYAQKFYQYGDDFWKIMGFENEKNLLMKHAGMSEAEAEKMAARRIRNTYPTYSMVGRMMHFLRRFPLAGTFVSFPSEIVRTVSNMLRYMAHDLKTPGMRPIAIRRMMGFSLAASFAYALQAMTRIMLGIDDDEEEAIRDLSPTWSKNSNFLFLGRDENGRLQYVDLSFLDPYNYWKRPLTAMLRNQPWDDAAVDSAREMLTPFLGTDIAAGAIFEVMANKKESGGHVYLEGDKPWRQTAAIADHLRKTLQPGIVSNLERTYKALAGQVSTSGKKYDPMEEAAGWGGWRMSTLDPKIALYYRTFEFKDDIRDASAAFNRVARNPNPVSRDELRQAIEHTRDLREEAFTKMRRMVNAAKASGLTDGEVATILRRAVVSRRDIAAIMSGKMSPWRPTPTSRRSAVRMAETLLGPEKSREFRRRYQEAMRTP